MNLNELSTAELTRLLKDQQLKKEKNKKTLKKIWLSWAIMEAWTKSRLEHWA